MNLAGALATKPNNPSAQTEICRKTKTKTRNKRHVEHFRTDIVPKDLNATQGLGEQKPTKTNSQQNMNIHRNVRAETYKNRSWVVATHAMVACPWAC